MVVFEILQWMGPEGWFQKPPDALQPETIYFGFLVNGPNRGQDAETAKQMQRGHLDYMDEALERASGDPMVKAGRLAVALYAWSIPKGILK